MYPQETSKLHVQGSEKNANKAIVVVFPSQGRLTSKTFFRILKSQKSLRDVEYECAHNVCQKMIFKEFIG